MSNKITKTEEQIEAEMAELRRQKRAVRRATKEAAERELSDALTGLARWLADRLELNTPADVERLRLVLDSGNSMDRLAELLAVENSTTVAAPSGSGEPSELDHEPTAFAPSGWSS